MTPPKRAQRKARIEALRTRMRTQREALRARRGTAASRKRRRPWWLLLLALLLLLWWPDCGTDPEPEGVAKGAAAHPGVDVPAPVDPPSTADRIQRRPRPRAPIRAKEAPSWLSQLRLQVAARSPRLARCFEGAVQPGRLRWTASVEPAGGRIQEHELEPILGPDALSGDQQDCAERVLSDPPYRLPEEAETSAPTRVSLIIEF